MSVSDKEKTAFTTVNGLYQFLLMPYGVTNGPPSFQRLMNTVLADVLWVICFVYFDDIIGFSKTFDDHVNHLDIIFKLMIKANLKINLSKFSFATTSVSYLSHSITPNGLKPADHKV
jgi:hypothetical protein